MNLLSLFSYFKFNQLPSNIELIIIDNGSNQDFYNNLLEISKKINNCKILSYKEKKAHMLQEILDLDMQKEIF